MSLSFYTSSFVRLVSMSYLTCSEHHICMMSSSGFSLLGNFLSSNYIHTSHYWPSCRSPAWLFHPGRHAAVPPLDMSKPFQKPIISVVGNCKISHNRTQQNSPDTRSDSLTLPNWCCLHQMLANRFIPFKLMQLFKTLKFARKTLQYYFNEGFVFHCELPL